MNDFMRNFNNPLMQAVNFTYKSKRYSLFGYWGISVIDDNGNEKYIDNDKLMTKHEALEYKAFDNGKKSLKDIIEEITDVEFDF
ncbi:MAG: hypothetical protein ACI4XH_07885 [Acutalibacteraceae bacterium]